jgi:hypothetical protein
MLTEREHNLKESALATLETNEATKEEIKKVCGRILEELEMEEEKCQ